jgi:hypothetical protein
MEGICPMKGFNHWYQNLSATDITRLTTILIASLVATAVSSVVSKWGMSSFGYIGEWQQLLVSAATTAVYAASVVAVFAIRLPTETRLAWQRIRTNKK